MDLIDLLCIIRYRSNIRAKIKKRKKIGKKGPVLNCRSSRLPANAANCVNRNYLVRSALTPEISGYL